jgi:hypothetical protein
LFVAQEVPTMAGQGFVPNEGKGGLANEDSRQGDREPKRVTPRVQGGPDDRGGMAGPNVGGSGVRGLQDDDNRGGPRTSNENETGVPNRAGVPQNTGLPEK